MRRNLLLSTTALLALTPGVSLAQTAPAPAQMGITATTPQSLQVLDSSKTWVPMGAIDPATHTWSMPIGGLVGILPPANGGLGAASLSGLLVGNGASAATAIVPGLGVPAALAATPTGTGPFVLAASPMLTGSVGVNTAPNWSNTYIPGSAIQTALIVQGTSTLWNGVLSASRTSQNANASPQNVIADTALAIDDNASHAQNLWARYTQVGVLNGAATAAQIFGEESSTAWFGSSNAASVDPYNSGSIVDGALFGVKYDAGYGGGQFTLTLTGNGSTGTATVTSPYGTALLATGYLVTVTGASISGFNVDAPVTVINGTQFTYPCTCSGTPTGSITATITPHDSSAAILISTNGGQYLRGIVTTGGALDTTANGMGEALAMSQAQGLIWYDGVASPVWEMFSNTASGDLGKIILDTSKLRIHIGAVEAVAVTEAGTTFGGPIIENFNSAGAFPTATNINGGSMQWNFSAANQEVDFFNSAFAATGFNSFYWEQQTGPSAATLLAKLGPSGFTLPVPLSVTNDGPNWASPGTSIYDYNRTALLSFPLNAEFGSGTVPVVQSVVGAIDIPSNSTVYQAHALAGYARSNGSATYGVGTFGQYTMGAAGGSGNGGNCIAINGPVQTATIGFSGGNMIGCEADVNVLPLASAAAPALNVYGFWAAGGSSIQPTGEFDGYHLEPAGSGIQWKNGFYMRDGSASTAINIGAVSGANGVGSMPVLYRARTTGGINITGDMYLDGQGNYVWFNGASGSGYFFKDGASAYAPILALGYYSNGAQGVSKTCTVLPTVVGGIITSC